MANRWYYKVGNEIVGPLDDGQLANAVKSGAINRGSRVRLGEDGPWGPVSLVSGLFSSTTEPSVAHVPAEELTELQDDLLSDFELEPQNVAAPAALVPVQSRPRSSNSASQWRIATIAGTALATLLIVVVAVFWLLSSGSNTEGEGGATADNLSRTTPSSSVTASNQPPAPGDAPAPAAPSTAARNPIPGGSKQTVLYLSDLKETRHEVWEYHPGFGFGTNGKFLDEKIEKSIVLAGMPSPKGILAHPKPNGVSRVVYDVNGQPYKFFEATIGVNDDSRDGPRTPLIFEVLGDGNSLWQSQPVTRWGQSQLCSIALPQIRELELRVRCPGDATFAFAVWFEPRLTNAASPVNPQDSSPVHAESNVPLADKELGTPGHPRGTSARLDLVEVVSKVQPSVVRVETDKGFGSGVIVDDRGAVLTTFHVIEGAKRVVVGLRSGKELESRGYLAIDPLHDLAVIATEKLDEGTAIKISEAMPKTGEKVAAFGNPKGFSFTTSEGIVAAVRGGRELINIVGQSEYQRLGYAPDATWIQTTAPISAGNSGGPLVNMSAELVGLNTMSFPSGQNLNFAISTTDIARMQVDRLAGKAPSRFDQLPTHRPRPAPKEGKQEEFTLTLPTGRVFSFKIFEISSSEFNTAAKADEKGIVLVNHPNGAPYAAAHQSDGKLHGVTIAQWENKQPMMHANYVKGKRHGVVKAWDEAGKPILFGQYTQNHKQGFFCFFEDGELRLLTQYKADKPEYIQLMSGEAALDGFKSEEDAKKDLAVRELLDKQDAFEDNLKKVEANFRKRVTEFENDRRQELAAQLAPEKRARMKARRQAVEAQNAAAHNELMRRFLGR